jgi:hypothetical protein
MGAAVERLARRLEAVRLARIPIPRHPRVVEGKTQDVAAHFRKVEGPLGIPVKRHKEPEGPIAKSLKRSPAGAAPREVRKKGKPGETRDNPIETGDVVEAARLLGEGKYVRLESKDEVATLVHELKKLVDDAKAKGKDAPKINLCNVTVENTNLFCVESKGIPRVEMPQLAGHPVPGSKADKYPKNKAGEVDLSADFAKYLSTHDITGDGIAEVIDDRHVKASHLKASQDELGGAQVAVIATAMEEKGIDPERAWIWTSNDNYVIDGHHRWAAQVAVGLGQGKDVDIPVHRVDLDIITILDFANGWTKKMGIKPKEHAAKPVELLKSPQQVKQESGS